MAPTLCEVGRLVGCNGTQPALQTLAQTRMYAGENYGFPELPELFLEQGVACVALVRAAKDGLVADARFKGWRNAKNTSQAIRVKAMQASLLRYCHTARCQAIQQA